MTEAPCRKQWGMAVLSRSGTIGSSGGFTCLVSTFDVDRQTFCKADWPERSVCLRPRAQAVPCGPPRSVNPSVFSRLQNHREDPSQRRGANCTTKASGIRTICRSGRLRWVLSLKLHLGCKRLGLSQQFYGLRGATRGYAATSRPGRMDRTVCSWETRLR